MAANMHIVIPWLRSVLRLPKRPKGQKLDLSKFELTWSDEFDGGSLDCEKWGLFQNQHQHWSLDLARVEDGKLHISTKHSEEGMRRHFPEDHSVFFDTLPPGYTAYPEGGYVHCPPGWYSLGLCTRHSFRQKFGYFEVRCKLPRGYGLNTAFWMMNDEVKDGSAGRDGTEIDIFEYPYYRKRLPPLRHMVSTNLHYGGYGKAWRMQNVGNFRVKAPYDRFHTYGLEWNENEYIFYIDGVESGRSSFGGVCQKELYIHISVEKKTKGYARWFWEGNIHRNRPGDITDYVLDYVRAYQKSKK